MVVADGIAAIEDAETLVGGVVGDGTDKVGSRVAVIEDSGVTVAGESFFGAPAAQADNSIAPSMKSAQKLAIVEGDL
jgi:hypothetical protein